MKARFRRGFPDTSDAGVRYFLQPIASAFWRTCDRSETTDIKAQANTYLLCTLARVASLKRSQRTLLGDKLIEKNSVILPITDVTTEVVHSMDMQSAWFLAKDSE